MHWIAPAEKDNDSSALEFAAPVTCLALLADSIQTRLNPGAPDISQIMGGINALLDESILGHSIKEQGPAPLDLSRINFQALARLKALLVVNWRQKAAARSQLMLAIEDTLDTGLPRAYTPELYRHKCAAVFEHMYESYAERNSGVYGCS